MHRLVLLSAAWLAVAASSQDDPSAVRLEIYDVRDLIAPGSAVDGAILAELIQSNVGTRNGVFQNGTFAVRASAGDHVGIRKTLDRVRKGDGSIITASIRIIISLQDLRSAKSDALVARLKREDVLQLTTRLMDESGFEPASIPRLSLFEGQAGHVFVGEQVSYVSQWRIAVGADGKGKPEPVSTIVNIGTTVTLVPSVENREICLDKLRIDLAEPRRLPPLMGKVETPHGTIQDPEIRTVQYDLNSPLRANETLLVGPLMKPWGGAEASKVWLLIAGEVVRAAR